jgi:DNA-binding CsgD family transcriptional regulator
VKGEALLEVGHLAEARRALRESANAMIRDDPGPYRPAVLAELSRACASMGDLAGSRAALDSIDAIEHYPPLFKGLTARARAWSLACSGQLKQAVGHAVATARMVGDLGQGGQESAQLHDVVRMGAPDQVADRLAALAASAQSALVSAYADHARALADDSAGGLEATALQFAGMGAELLAAEVWVEASLAYERGGDHRASRRCTISADELLANCGGARTPSLSLIAAWSGLTTREIEIASLAAEGLAAREIAARCMVSARTVENHLHNVYLKLGIVGRDQLGLALRRQLGD